MSPSKTDPDPLCPHSLDTLSNAVLPARSRRYVTDSFDPITGTAFRIIIGDLIVITAMYFDAYLKGRNAPTSHLHPQGAISQVSTETASKFTMLRPPMPQGNPVISKQPYPDLRSDNNKSNTSAHIFLSAAKPSNLPQRVASNYPTRAQTGMAPLGPFSRHQLPEQQKYICQSPGKVGSRTSAGLVFEEIPQNRYDYRRSESITDLKPSSETFRDSSIHYYPNNRQSNDYQDPRSATISTSPLPVRFNPYPERGRVVRKESEGPLLTNREERAEPPFVKEPYSQKKIFKQSYSDLFQNKPQIPTFDPNKFEYIPARVDTVDPKKYDFEGRKFEFEGKRVDTYKNFEQVYKNSGILQPMPDAIELKKQSSQDFLKKYSASKLPQLDKSLDQDIETLRFASKKTDEILDRELNKNAYLNQLFEQKGLRGPLVEDRSEPKDFIKEKKEVAARNIAFEREIQDKNRELGEKNKELAEKCNELLERNRDIAEKNKQISQKGKLIGDKNKIIEAMVIELRELQEQLSKRQSKLLQIETAKRGEISTLQTELTQHTIKITQLQHRLKEAEEVGRSKLQQKTNAIEALQNILEQFKKKAEMLENQLDNANRTILQLQISINDINSITQGYEVKIDELSIANDSLKQKCQSEKLSLITLYKKETADLRAKFEAERQTLDQAKEQSNIYLQAQIVELNQRNILLEEDLSTVNKNYKEIIQKYDNIYGQYSQIGSLLLLPEGFTHEKLTGRLKECLEGYARSEGMQIKEVQRLQDYQIQKLQQEHLERRHQELSRELKKVGTRLAGASIEAQQGGRLLREANQEILVMHLINLNEKYRFLLENQ